MFCQPDGLLFSIHEKDSVAVAAFYRQSCHDLSPAIEDVFGFFTTTVRLDVPSCSTVGLVHGL